MQEIDAQLRERYNYFLDVASKDWNYKIPVAMPSKKQQEEILYELVNAHVSCVQGLTETDTKFVRRRLGIGGAPLSFTEIGTFYNVEPTVVTAILNEAKIKILKRIKRGYANLEQGVLDGTLSQEDLLALPIDVLENIDLATLRLLKSERYVYIKDLVNHSLSEVKSVCPSEHLKNIEKISEYMKVLGLSFKEDKIKEEKKDKKVTYTTENEYLINYDKQLIEKLDDLDKELDIEIQKLQERKKQILTRKQELLDEIDSLEEKDKVKSL